MDQDCFSWGPRQQLAISWTSDDVWAHDEKDIEEMLFVQIWGMID